MSKKHQDGFSRYEKEQNRISRNKKNRNLKVYG